VTDLAAFVCSLASQDAASFIGTLHDIGVMEATRKLLGFARVLPAGKSTCRVYVWSYHDFNTPVGHATLILSDNTYISWWPSVPNQTPLTSYPLSTISAINTPSFEVLAMPNRSYNDDLTAEARPPDYVIGIERLDEAKIKMWWVE